MKKILLFLFLFPTVVFAQRYNSPNVHFYLPDGYSIKDLGKAQDPYNSLSPLYLYVIVINDYNISFGTINSADMPNKKDKYISELNRKIKVIANRQHYSLQKNLSNGKNTVYSYTNKKIAISSNYKKVILWRDGYEDERETLYEININKVLPEESNYDFLE